MLDIIYEFAHESRELATVISSAAFSLSFALFLSLFTTRTNSKILRDFRNLGTALFAAAGFLFFMLAFESLFALVGKGSWGFFPFLALDAAAVLAVFLSVFIPLGKLVDRGNIRHMKENPALTEVADIVRRENATAVYCCTDGVRILYNETRPTFFSLTPHPVCCRSREEFNAQSYRMVSFAHVCAAQPGSTTDISFRDYGFPNMCEADIRLFLDTLCSLVPGYDKLCITSEAQFHYYKADAVTKKRQSGNFTDTKKTGFYGVAVRQDCNTAKKAPQPSAPKPPQKNQNRW